MSATTAPYLVQLANLKAQLEADPNEFLRTTQDLRDADLLLIGKLIQLYCFADLNARRIIDSLRSAADDPSAGNASKLVDADVFPHLHKAADLLWNSNMKDGLHKAAYSIEINRSHRHLFAHWSARRVRNHNVLILFSKNATEARRRDGISQEPDELKFGMVPLDAFATELPILEAHTMYLAECASDLERDADAYRKRFSEISK